MAKKAVSTGEHAALLLSVGTRECYRRECKRPLVVVRDGDRIVDFEVAHIRDELPPVVPNADLGWRYWPSDLSQQDRNRYGNLLLLCPPCHKLIDKIRPREFSVDLLHEWKRVAEAGDPATVEALRTELFDREQLVEALSDALQAKTTIHLQLPGFLTADGLSFASRSTTFTGRTDELAKIDSFLSSSESFSWWVVVGPAGMGKSRLALEACYVASADWEVGFISDADQAQMLHFAPERPTLLVVDYAASRAEWLAQLLACLAERANPEDPSVRLLILERDISSTWFDVATLRSRHHVSVRILSAQYAEPLSLGGLSRDDTRELVRLDAEVSDRPMTATDIEDIVDRALELDPARRPLFTLIACIEHREPAGLRRSRDHL